MADTKRKGPVSPEGRVPPYDREAEVAVLGSILLRNDAIDVAETILDSSDFFQPGHRVVYEAMLALHKDGVGIDHVTLGAALKDRGDLGKIGGPGVLRDLTEAVATAANVEHYLGIVRRHAATRRVLAAAAVVQQVGMPGPASGPEELERALAALETASAALSRSRMPTNLLTLGDGVLAMYDRVAHGYSGIPLPWPSINGITSGMWPRTVTLFVARPGVGKSQVAVLAARHAWMQGFRVLIVSPEMGRDEIAERFFTVEASVSYQRLVRGQLSDFELPALEKTVEECKVRDGVYILDSEDDLSPRGIEAAIRACRPKLLAVDALYDLKLHGERRDRFVAAVEWIKNVVKRYELAGCAFAQQNRLAEMSEKKGGGSRLGTIGLGDEAGQDAHAVYALEQDKDMRNDNRMLIRPLKARRGSFAGLTDGVEVNWNFSDMLFDEIDRGEEGNEYDEKDDEVPF